MINENSSKYLRTCLLAIGPVLGALLFLLPEMNKPLVYSSIVEIKRAAGHDEFASNNFQEALSELRERISEDSGQKFDFELSFVSDPRLTLLMEVSDQEPLAASKQARLLSTQIVEFLHGFEVSNRREVIEKLKNKLELESLSEVAPVESVEHSNLNFEDARIRLETLEREKLRLIEALAKENVSETINRDARVSDLRLKLEFLDEQFLELSSLLRPAHPKMVGIVEDTKVLIEELDLRKQYVIEDLKSDLESVSNQISELSKVTTGPEAEDISIDGVVSSSLEAPVNLIGELERHQSLVPENYSLYSVSKPASLPFKPKIRFSTKTLSKYIGLGLLASVCGWSLLGYLKSCWINIVRLKFDEKSLELAEISTVKVSSSESSKEEVLLSERIEIESFKPQEELYASYSSIPEWSLERSAPGLDVRPFNFVGSEWQGESENLWGERSRVNKETLRKNCYSLLNPIDQANSTRTLLVSSVDKDGYQRAVSLGVAQFLAKSGYPTLLFSFNETARNSLDSLDDIERCLELEIQGVKKTKVVEPVVLTFAEPDTGDESRIAGILSDFVAKRGELYSFIIVQNPSEHGAKGVDYYRKFSSIEILAVNMEQGKFFAGETALLKSNEPNELLLNDNSLPEIIFEFEEGAFEA